MDGHMNTPIADRRTIPIKQLTLDIHFPSVSRTSSYVGSPERYVGSPERVSSTHELQAPVLGVYPYSPRVARTQELQAPVSRVDDVDKPDASTERLPDYIFLVGGDGSTVVAPSEFGYYIHPPNIESARFSDSTLNLDRHSTLKLVGSEKGSKNDDAAVTSFLLGVNVPKEGMNVPGKERDMCETDVSKILIGQLDVDRNLLKSGISPNSTPRRPKKGLAAKAESPGKARSPLSPDNREEWKTRQWTKGQGSKLQETPEISVANLSINLKNLDESGEVAAVSTTFKETIERRAQARNQDSRESSRAAVKTSSSSHTGLGSRADRNINVHGLIYREQLDSQTPKANCRKGEWKGQEKDYSINLESSHTDQVMPFSNEREPVIVNGEHKKKPTFCPRQITDQITCDEEFFADTWQEKSSKEKYKPDSLDLQNEISVRDLLLGLVSPQERNLITTKREIEVSRQCARQILLESSVVDYGVQRQTSVREKSPHCTPRYGISPSWRMSSRESMLQNNIDFLAIVPSDSPPLTVNDPPPCTVNDSEDMTAGLCINAKQVPFTKVRSARIDDQSGKGKGLSREKMCKDIQKGLTHRGTKRSEHPTWRMERKYDEQHSCKRSEESKRNTAPSVPTTQAPPPEKAFALASVVDERIPVPEPKAPPEFLYLHASAVAGQPQAYKAMVPGKAAAQRVDAAIMSKAHFRLEYMAESDWVQLVHVDRILSTLLWEGSSSVIEHLVFDLEDRIGVQQFAGLQRFHRRRHKVNSATSGGSHDMSDVTLQQWLRTIGKEAAESGSRGDVRSFHFVPEGVMREFVAVKRQLFSPHAKQRSQTAFFDGRCALLCGKVNNLEYVKGMILRCPANPTINSAKQETSVKGGLHLASDITLDLVMSHSAWSREEGAKRSKFALRDQLYSERPEANSKVEKTVEAMAAAGVTPALTTAQGSRGPAHQFSRIEQIQGTSSDRPRTVESDRSRPHTAVSDRPASPGRLLQMPSMLVKQLPLKTLIIEQTVGLPRYMSPRPLGFESSDQVEMMFDELHSQGRSNSPPRGRAGAAIIRRFTDKVNDEASQSITENAKQLHSHDGSARGDLQHIASRPPLSVEGGVKKRGSSESRGSGMREPVPPSLKNNAPESFSNRRLSRVSQQHARESATDQGMPALDKDICGENSLAGVLNAFFPPIHVNDPINRRLPAENDNCGFRGSLRNNSRSLLLNSATSADSSESMSTPADMGVLPMGFFLTLLDRRETDAAIARTPRFVDVASKHSGNVLRNPLAPSARELACKPAKRSKQAASFEEDGVKFSNEQDSTPGYITDRRFRVK